MGTKVAYDSQHHHVKAVGRRIALARGGKEWTHSQLARKAGIHRSEVAHLEKGDRPRVSAHVLASIARVLGLSMDALWWGETGPDRSADELLHALGAALQKVSSSKSGPSTKPREGEGGRGRGQSRPS